MLFRPCIDLHEGKVKQIIGSTLHDNQSSLQTNFVASESPAYFAQLYKKDNLHGGHVIMLGPGNEAAAKEALAAYPDALHIGGGINPDNAASWLDAGAAKVIVTSYIFPNHEFSREALQKISTAASPEKLVLDLSCKKEAGKYVVACNRWQNLTSLVLDKESIEDLSNYCSEFLIHAVDLEGKQGGIDLELVAFLADNIDLPVTYAGGVSSLEDIAKIEKIGKGKVDFTVGSALDIFGGKLLKYNDLKKYNISAVSG